MSAYNGGAVSFYENGNNLKSFGGIITYDPHTGIREEIELVNDGVDGTSPLGGFD